MVIHQFSMVKGKNRSENPNPKALRTIAYKIRPTPSYHRQLRVSRSVDVDGPLWSLALIFRFVFVNFKDG